MKKSNWIGKFLVWRIKHIDDKNFVLMLSILIGILAGLAAVVLKESVHLLQAQVTKNFNFNESRYYFILIPPVGIALTYLLAKYVLKEHLGHGITTVLYFISKKGSKMKRSLQYSRLLTSAVTVGLGGSVGLEAPIVVTGSSIGSNLGRIMHLSYKKRTLLIGCGAAGAISAIFNSPIAGVIFAIEVIFSEITIATFIPLLIASVSGSVISLSLLGEHVLFSHRIKEDFSEGNILYYAGLGLITGIFSVYFTRVMFYFESLTYKIKGGLKRALIGGTALGIIIFILPPLYGEGYGIIKQLLNNQGENLISNSLFFDNTDSVLFLFIFLFVIIMVKPIATALTIGSGGSGGIFGPSLFLGGVTGYLYALLVNFIFSAEVISPANFTLVGMCGIMSGVLHAPLTAIFLIAEITSGYELFIPLMLVSALAYNTAKNFEKFSFYSKPLVESGDLVNYDKDKQLLSLIDLNKIIEKDLLTIDPEATLGTLVELVQKSRRNIFPVVSDKNELVGIVTLDDVRSIMFDEDSRKNIIIKSIMHSPPAYVSSKESMESVMHKFEITGAWNLPVIDEGKYAGFLSKSRIFNAYRTRLRRQQKD
ncbi:chloride channel protein [Mangrovivirga cuniculi]|uniref:Chloride channel protein n=1 Tax=Mangrovivirga cuniculi TaxID=2715131 RepID=A0A4D7JS38_9BACT|nr:chloride channel protein [Mangrovivirga cuniculi]QCK13745.1 chloride channel protein [Mangrovivirga cuniculi]